MTVIGVLICCPNFMSVRSFQTKLLLSRGVIYMNLFVSLFPVTDALTADADFYDREQDQEEASRDATPHKNT